MTDKVYSIVRFSRLMVSVVQCSDSDHYAATQRAFTILVFAPHAFGCHAFALFSLVFHVLKYNIIWHFANPICTQVSVIVLKLVNRPSAIQQIDNVTTFVYLVGKKVCRRYCHPYKISWKLIGLKAFSFVNASIIKIEL